MKLTIVLFVLLFSGLILAGDVGNTETGKPGKTRSDGENQLLQLRIKEGAQVIFSAATVGGHKNIRPFHKDTTLIYRTVMTNIGNAYSPSTGIFTAPFAGVYYFTISFHAGKGREAKLLLYKNNEHVLTTHNQPSSDTADNGGNTAFLMLRQGDQMYVRMGENTPAGGSDYHTIFSGFSGSDQVNVEQICNGYGYPLVNSGPGNLCMSTSILPGYYIEVDNNCKVKPPVPTETKVIVACDVVDNQCRPVHFEKYNHQKPNTMAAPCQPA